MENLGLVQFISALTGVVLAVWSLVSACLELHALVLKKQNGAKKLGAISNIVRDAFTMSVQVVAMLVGLSTFVFDADALQAVPVWRQMAWVIVSGLLSSGLIVDRVRRIRVAQMYDVIDPPKTTADGSYVHRRATDE